MQGVELLSISLPQNSCTLDVLPVICILHDLHAIGLKTVQDVLGDIDGVTVKCRPLYYGPGSGVNILSANPLYTAFILASSKVELPNQPNVHLRIDIHGTSDGSSAAMRVLTRT